MTTAIIMASKIIRVRSGTEQVLAGFCIVIPFKFCDSSVFVIYDIPVQRIGEKRTFFTADREHLKVRLVERGRND
jgi:hypothetical protein